ncbi:MAG TPA: hypothetical protein VGJ20_28975 [Xanthobacteraceae bacterium]|jgi:hypothetical protein
MASPHELAHRYRIYVLAVGFIICILAGALIPPQHVPSTTDASTITIALFFGLMWIAGYWAMRLFVRVFVRPLRPSFPRFVDLWALACFYGAVPLTVIGALFGTTKLHVAPPTSGSIAMDVVAAAAMGFGAIVESIQTSRVV